MKTKILTGTLALLMVGLAFPSNAYHIDEPLAGTWVVQNGLVNACESNGPDDPRLPRPAATPGVGGLCTTGQNALTGVGAINARPGQMGNWVRLDVCDDDYTVRTPGDPCNLSGGRTDQHGFSGRVGAFTCFVPTDGVPLDILFGALVTNDYALYYDELYAWWSYDGSGNYTVNAATGVDNETGFHGHAAVFVDPVESKPGASVTGSVETAYAAPPGTLSDDPADALDGFTNNCGGSPSNAPCDCMGPVVRAINAANQVTVFDSGNYVAAGTGGIATDVQALVDAGVAVCLPTLSPVLGNNGIGGTCLSFNALGDVVLNDDISGTDVVFQVCIDHNQNGLCEVDPVLDNTACQEVWFSHDLMGTTNNNPMTMEVGGVPVTALNPLCPNTPGIGPVLNTWDGYVVLPCVAAHLTATPHVHNVPIIGTASWGPGGSPSGFDSADGFCGQDLMGSTVGVQAKAYVVI